MFAKLFSKAGLFGVAFAVTGALGATVWASTAPTETRVWREAYQSSPARYDPLAPEFVKMLVEKFKMPPAVVEQMRPQTASGTQRVRLVVSAGGPQIRVRVSNEEATEPLVLTAASVGLAGEGMRPNRARLNPSPSAAIAMSPSLWAPRCLAIPSHSRSHPAPS